MKGIAGFLFELPHQIDVYKRQRFCCMDRQNAFREQEMNMGIKVKKILTGTALIMSLCMFTACGNANKAADEADTNWYDGPQELNGLSLR